MSSNKKSKRSLKKVISGALLALAPLAVMALPPHSLQASPMTLVATWTPEPTLEPGQPTPSVRHVDGRNTTVGVKVPEKPVKPGEAFDVVITIDTDTQTRGASFSVKFDATKMEVTGMEEGEFYKKWAVDNGFETIIAPKPNADNEKGLISVSSVVVMGPKALADVVSGSGSLMIIHAKAKPDASGQAEVTPADILIADRGDDVGTSASLEQINIQGGVVVFGDAGDAAAPAVAAATLTPQAQAPATAVKKNEQPTAKPTRKVKLNTDTNTSTDATSVESTVTQPQTGGGSVPWQILIPGIGVVVLGGVLALVFRKR